MEKKFKECTVPNFRSPFTHVDVGHCTVDDAKSKLLKLLND